MSKGLRSLRGIEHHINFLLGDTILIYLSYQSNPKDIKELQRQVDELLFKGHVRDGLSSCVLLMLLVSKKDNT